MNRLTTNNCTIASFGPLKLNKRGKKKRLGLFLSGFSQPRWDEGRLSGALWSKRRTNLGNQPATMEGKAV